MIMRRNVSDDGHMFKETKFLMYSSRGNDGYVTKTVSVQICKNFKTKKLSAMFPSSTTMSSSVQSTLLLGFDSLIASQNTRTRVILL